MNESAPQGEPWNIDLLEKCGFELDDPLDRPSASCPCGLCADYYEAVDAGLTLPAVVQVEPELERHSLGVWQGGPAMFAQTDGKWVRYADVVASLDHRAAPRSPSALRAAPFSEPRSIGQGELPVRAEMEKVLEALDAIADDFNPDRPSDAYLALEEMRDAIRALRAAMSAPGGGGAAA